MSNIKIYGRGKLFRLKLGKCFITDSRSGNDYTAFVVDELNVGVENMWNDKQWKTKVPGEKPVRHEK
jgi:hypothetical protein